MSDEKASTWMNTLRGGETAEKKEVLSLRRSSRPYFRRGEGDSEKREGKPCCTTTRKEKKRHPTVSWLNEFTGKLALG